MMNMQSERATRFLAAYAAIEIWLQKTAQLDHDARFYDLIAIVKPKHRVVRDFAFELQRMGDLRNFLVHRRGDGKALVEPLEDAVQQIESIRVLLERPPLVVDTVRVAAVEACDPTDSIGLVAARMLAGSFSQMPVIDDGKIGALMTAETMARWMGAQLASGIGLLEEMTVASVLPYAEDPDNYRVKPRTTTALDALDLFRDYTERRKSLDAILITHSGKSTEAPLTIVTTYDIPTLTSATAV